MEKIEIKGFDFEFKALSEEGEFEGYAAVFNNVDLGGDKILPGAFARTLKKTGGVVPIMADHITRDQIGWGIEAMEDKRGLKVHGKLNLSIQRAAEKYALAKQAAEVSAKMGLSIGYESVKREYDGDVRVLKEVVLHEYSIVTFPMNERATMTAVKGGRLVLAPEGVPTNIREFESYLRDGGFSNKQAKRIASLAFQTQRDADFQEVLDAIEEAKKTLTGGI